MAYKLLEGINAKLDKIEMLHIRSMATEKPNAYRDEIFESYQLIELLLKALLLANGYKIDKNGKVKKDGKYVSDNIFERSILTFCSRFDESPIPAEYRKFLIILNSNHYETLFHGKKITEKII